MPSPRVEPVAVDPLPVLEPSWIRALPHDLRPTALDARGDTIALVAEHEAPYVTPADAGGLIFRKAGAVLVFDLQGHEVFSHEMQGAATDIVPVDVAVHGSGHVDALVRSPIETTSVAFDASRWERRQAERSSPARGLTLRLLRYLPSGERYADVDLRSDGRAVLSLQPDEQGERAVKAPPKQRDVEVGPAPMTAVVLEGARLGAGGEHLHLWRWGSKRDEHQVMPVLSPGRLIHAMHHGEQLLLLMMLTDTTTPSKVVQLYAFDLLSHTPTSARFDFARTVEALRNAMPSCPRPRLDIEGTRVVAASSQCVAFESPVLALGELREREPVMYALGLASNDEVDAVALVRGGVLVAGHQRVPARVYAPPSAPPRTWVAYFELPL